MRVKAILRFLLTVFGGFFLYGALDILLIVKDNSVLDLIIFILCLSLTSWVCNEPKKYDNKKNM